MSLKCNACLDHGIVRPGLARIRTIMVRVVRATQVEIETAVQALRDGELVAFPTETVYGLGANAQNPAAVRKIFEAKGRPSNHPVIVHLDSPALPAALGAGGAGYRHEARGALLAGPAHDGDAARPQRS